MAYLFFLFLPVYGAFLSIGSLLVNRRLLAFFRSSSHFSPPLDLFFGSFLQRVDLLPIGCLLPFLVRVAILSLSACPRAEAVKEALSSRNVSHRVCVANSSSWYRVRMDFSTSRISVRNFQSLPSSCRGTLVSTIVYIAMGWLVVIAAGPLSRALPLRGLAWLLAGGLAYTLGVAFFGSSRFRFNHAVWHLFVLAGSAYHYVAVMRYVLPHVTL